MRITYFFLTTNSGTLDLSLNFKVKMRLMANRAYVVFLQILLLNTAQMQNKIYD